MDRYWKSDAATAAPVVPASNAGGFPSNGDAAAGVDGTVPGAWWYHSITEEIRNAILKLGTTPDWTKTDQLGTAIASVLGGASTAFAGSGGSALVGFVQAGAGAIPRTVQDKLRDTIHVKDFGALGDGIADDTLAIRKAIAALPPSNAVLDFGGGTYLVTNANGLLPAPDSAASTYALVIAGLSNVALVGHGARIIAALQPTDLVTMAIADCSQIEVRGLTFDGLTHYTANSIPSFKQQLLHLLNPRGAWIHHCRFANSANIGLLATAQYQIVAPTRFPSSNMVEITACTFDNCLQNSTYGTGIDVLNIHHCVFRNPVFAAWKMSATDDTSAAPGGDVGHFKDVIWDANIVFYDGDYVNPQSALGDGPNTYRVMLDGVSFAKQYKVTNSVFDNAGVWNDGITSGGIGVKIEPASENHNYQAKPNTRVDLSGNKFFDVNADGAVTVSVSPFIDDAVLRANEFYNCYRGIDVNNGTVTVPQNYPDASRSRFSIRDNEFFGTLNREIAIVSFFGDSLFVTGNRASLKGQPRGTAQFIYVSAINSTLSRLVISGNCGDRQINVTAIASEWEIDDNTCAADSGRALSVGAQTIATGSRAFLRRNRVDSPQGMRADGLAGPGGWIEYTDNTVFNCTEGAWYANRLGDGVSLIGVFRHNLMASGSVTGDTKYNVQNSQLLIDADDAQTPDLLPRLSAAAVNGSTVRVIGSSASKGISFVKAAGGWVAIA
jgi:hypothetical protein